MAIITLEQLRQFCIEQKINNFSAKQPEDAIVISVPSTFKKVEFDDDRFTKIRLKSCHTLKNLNNSYISQEAMEQAMPTFVNRPILASIVELEDEDGNPYLDFNGHDAKVSSDKMDSGKSRVEYVEIPVGIIPETCNMSLESEDNEKREYLYVDGYVYKDYTYASDIIEQRGEVDVSVEIAVSKYSYDANDQIIYIEEFVFLGITLLGAHVEPGMSGSRATLVEREGKETNTEFTKIFNAINELKEMYSLSSKTKGGLGLDKLTELLQKYSKTVEDITFEYENMTDEELEQAFADNFEEEGENSQDPEATPEPSDEGETEPEATPEPEGEMSRTVDVSFQISHEDIRARLYDLIEEADDDLKDEDGYWSHFYITATYDDTCIYHDYQNGKYYKRAYSVIEVEGEDKEDVVELVGDREEVFQIFVTSEERDAIDKLRSDYETALEELSAYQTSEQNAEKDNILNQSDYEILKDNEEFKAVVEHKADYTLEELQDKVDLVFAKAVKENPSILIKDNKPNRVALDVYGFEKQTESKKKAYGSLFD